MIVIGWKIKSHALCSMTHIINIIIIVVYRIILNIVICNYGRNQDLTYTTGFKKNQGSSSTTPYDYYYNFLTSYYVNKIVPII